MRKKTCVPQETFPGFPQSHVDCAARQRRWRQQEWQNSASTPAEQIWDDPLGYVSLKPDIRLLEKQELTILFQRNVNSPEIRFPFTRKAVHLLLGKCQFTIYLRYSHEIPNPCIYANIISIWYKTGIILSIYLLLWRATKKEMWRLAWRSRSVGLLPSFLPLPRFPSKL